MTKREVVDLYDYTEWANDRVAGVILTLAPERLTQNFGGSYPTIRDAFAHIAGAEWLWLERWLGHNPRATPDWLSVTDPTTLVAQLRDVEQRRRAYLEELTDEALDDLCAFNYLNGTADEHRLRDLFVHVANHSTFHRGQVVSMLRQAGSPAQPTDFIVYRNIVKARA